MKKRPINLELTTFQFPIMAIISILHRISGVVLLLFIPIALVMLNLSLVSAESFAQLKTCLSIWWVKIPLWLMLTALIYHVVAGIRHIIMDFGFAETLSTGKKSSYFVIIISILLSLLLLIFIW